MHNGRAGAGARVGRPTDGTPAAVPARNRTVPGTDGPGDREVGMGRSARGRWGRWIAAGVLSVVGAAASAQQSAPVYIADATMAEEAMATVGDLMARGGADEAVRLVQRVLEEQGHRLTASDRPGVFVGVRERLHAIVLGNPALLEAYRVRQNPRAAVLLESGRWAEVADRWWLTRSGFEAGLRRAQMLIEAGAFRAGARTVEELLAHPDARVRSADAAALAAEAAAYAGTDRAWRSADAWAELAGLAKPERVSITPPARAPSGPISALAWNAGARDGAGALEGLVSRSLHSAELTELVPGDFVEPDPNQAAARVELGWTLPTIAGADLYTNDGLTLTSFDRFTLRPRWRVVEPMPADADGRTRQSRARIGRIAEDSGTVTVGEAFVYAALGPLRPVAEESVGRVVCVDRATGRMVWSVVPGRLSEELAGAEPRGPLVLDGGVLVVGARKNLRTRRLVSLTLLGLDARTGELLWSRSLGSAGSLPFQQSTQLSEGGVLRDGVVYWTDKVGLAAALETATGRVLWVRQTPTPNLYNRGVRTPYATSLPVITDHGLFVLAPDQDRILRLDPETGELLSARPTQPAGQATYLVPVGGRIASVGSNRVAFYDPAAFDGADPVVTPVIDEAGVRGRAVEAGGRLAVPVSAGVALIDPAAPARTETLALDATGNVLLADGQAVVLDETRAHSFLSWDAASGMLGELVRAGDLGAALTLADLARRSGREERMIAAVDDAVRLAARSERAATDRTRVFEAVRALAEPDPRAGAVSTSARGVLLDRMGSVARTTEQRVTHALALGAWKAGAGDPQGAAAAYQDVLLDPAWARAVWSGGGLSVRAELEATRRLHDLAERYGSRATGVTDAMARAEADALGDAGSGEAWEGVARRYPASAVAPEAWARAASAWTRERRWPAAERGARAGLRAAAALARRDASPDRAVLNELAGVLAGALSAQGRPDEAALALADAAAAFGELAPTLDGRPVAVVAETPARRHPAIGARAARTEAPLLLTGSPVSASVPGRPDLVLMHAGHVGLLSVHRAGDLARGEGRPLWSEDDAGPTPPVLAHSDARSIVLVWPDEPQEARPARAEARDPETGAVLWSADLRFEIDRVDPGPDPASRSTGQIVSPLEGAVPNAHLIAVSDGRTLVTTDRLGRGVAVDLADGRVLWRRLFGMTRVYGADLRGGVLGLCGAAVRRAAPDADPFDAPLRGVGEAIDARTGDTIQLIDDLGAETRWVRVAQDGQVVIGAGVRVVALDTVTGRIDWSNADEQLAASMDAWIVGDGLVVLARDRVLWMLSRREGVRQRSPVDTLGRGADRGWIGLHDRPFGVVALTPAGVTTHAPDGTLLAADALDPRRPFGLSVLGERRAVLVDRGEVDPDGRSVVGVAIVDARTGRADDRVLLMLPEGVRRSPTRAAIADGVLVVGFGEVSMVVPAPGGEG